MTTLLSPVLDVVNSAGSFVASSVSVIVNVNHFIASNFVAIAAFVLGGVKSIVNAVFTAVFIALEDFSTFVGETSECVVTVIEAVFDAIDTFFANASWAASRSWAGVVGTLVASYNGLVSAFCAISDFFSLFGKSVVLLIKLIPQSLYHFINGVFGILNYIITSAQEAAVNAIGTFRAAPFEALIGVASCAVLTYSLIRLAKRLIERHRRGFDTSSAVRAFVAVTCFVYVHAVRAALTLVCFGLRCVATVLSNLHVPRFHHAGVDNDEDDVDEGANAVPETIDSSDNEENERAADKRRNYDRLLQRRESRRRRQNEEEDVEDLLFEQMEREREDKLCVICQDFEKCIMILPCRHLCICQNCSEPLRRLGNNVCPICRKNVRQTIKAYL